MQHDVAREHHAAVVPLRIGEDVLRGGQRREHHHTEQHVTSSPNAKWPTSHAIAGIGDELDAGRHDHTPAVRPGIQRPLSVQRDPEREQHRGNGGGSDQFERLHHGVRELHAGHREDDAGEPTR